MGDNSDQRLFWSQEAGQQWVAHDRALSAHFAPVLDRLLEHAQIAPKAKVLDLGCGTGAASRAAAQAVGPAGHVAGVDISPAMIAAAKQQTDAKQLEFLCADAANMAFAPGSFDVVISRFGAMFFDDPPSAFANIAKAMRSGARLHLACWAGSEQNPWFTLPARAARAVLGAPPKTDPDAPGPFAFRTPERVAGILAAAGLTQVSSACEEITITPPGTLGETAALMADVGPAGGALRYFQADYAERRAVETQIAAGLAQHVTGSGQIALPAAVMFYAARKP